MKNKIFISLIGLFLASTLIANAQLREFVSSQVGSSPSVGKVLQTNGSISTWVATSSLGFPVVDTSSFVSYTYGSSTYYFATNPSGYISSTTNALINYPTYTYASSTYYLATNPSNYIDATALSPYLTLTYASTTFVNYGYASSTYYFSTNPSGYISSTTNTLTNYPSYTYASSSYALLTGANFTGDITTTGSVNSSSSLVSNIATVNELCFSGTGLCMSAPSVSGTNITLFFWNDSADIAGYERLRTYPNNGTEIAETATSSSGS